MFGVDGLKTRGVGRGGIALEVGLEFKAGRVHIRARGIGNGGWLVAWECWELGIGHSEGEGDEKDEEEEDIYLVLIWNWERCIF